MVSSLSILCFAVVLGLKIVLTYRHHRKSWYRCANSDGVYTLFAISYQPDGRHQNRLLHTETDHYKPETSVEIDNTSARTEIFQSPSPLATKIINKQLTRSSGGSSSRPPYLCAVYRHTTIILGVPRRKSIASLIVYEVSSGRPSSV